MKTETKPVHFYIIILSMLGKSISELRKRYYALKIQLKIPNKNFIGWTEKGITVSTLNKLGGCFCSDISFAG